MSPARFRQRDFAEPRPWSGPHQANVVGDPEHSGGKARQRPMREHKGIVRGQRLELVFRGSERQSGQFLDFLGETLGKFGMRVEPCADRGAPCAKA